MDIRFVIPAGWTDIRRLVHEFIHKWHLYRICIMNKNASPPKLLHNSSEFPALPKDPEERYRTLAYRLDNVRPVENMLMSWEHPAIQTRNETIGTAQEGLR